MGGRHVAPSPSGQAGHSRSTCAHEFWRSDLPQNPFGRTNSQFQKTPGASVKNVGTSPLAPCPLSPTREGRARRRRRRAPPPLRTSPLRSAHAARWAAAPYPSLPTAAFRDSRRRHDSASPFSACAATDLVGGRPTRLDAASCRLISMNGWHLWCWIDCYLRTRYLALSISGLPTQSRSRSCGRWLWWESNWICHRLLCLLVSMNSCRLWRWIDGCLRSRYLRFTNVISK